MNVSQKKNAPLRGSRFAGRLLALSAVIALLFAGCEAALAPMDMIISEPTTAPVDVESSLIDAVADDNYVTVSMTGGKWSRDFMEVLAGGSPSAAVLADYIEIVWLSSPSGVELTTSPFTITTIGKSNSSNDIILDGNTLTGSYQFKMTLKAAAFENQNVSGCAITPAASGGGKNTGFESAVVGNHTIKLTLSGGGAWSPGVKEYTGISLPAEYFSIQWFGAGASQLTEPHLNPITYTVTNVYYETATSKVVIVGNNIPAPCTFYIAVKEAAYTGSGFTVSATASGAITNEKSVISSVVGATPMAGLTITRTGGSWSEAFNRGVVNGDWPPNSAGGAGSVGDFVKIWRYNFDSSNITGGSVNPGNPPTGGFTPASLSAVSLTTSNLSIGPGSITYTGAIADGADSYYAVWFSKDAFATDATSIAVTFF